jgi:hypothetical protein
MFPQLNSLPGGDVQWRVRSHDLAAYGYCLWGYFKSTFAISKPKTIEELKQRIKEKIATVPAQITRLGLEKLRGSFEQCLRNGGSI